MDIDVQHQLLQKNCFFIIAKRLQRCFCLLVLSWTFTLLVIPLVLAATLDVCPTSCPYSTIQGAVNAAASGDTIEIGPGTYVEVVQVNIPNLSFVGAGSASTIVDGPLSAFVFNASAGGASLSGVTLHSQVTGSCIQNYADLVVQDSILENCSNDLNGGGIYTSGDLVLERVTVLASHLHYSQINPIEGRGGGLFVDGNPTSGGPTVRIYDSAFGANEALYGGGIYIGTGAKVYIDGTIFSDNSAHDSTGLLPYTGRGGAIRTFGELHVTNSTFFYNWADLFGGAIAVNSGSAPVYIATSVLFENFTNGETFTAGGLPSGGGLYVESGGEVKVVGTEFYGNRSGYGGGIGVYNLLQQGTVNLVQGSLAYNTADGDGGGLWVYGGNVTVNTSTVSLNLAKGNGGGAYGAYGSGIIDFRSSTIVDNLAYGTGGGLNANSMSLRNSILARNNASISNATGSTDDCNQSFDSSDHNLVGTVDGCGVLNLLPNDLSGTDTARLDPQLGPLSDSDGAIEAGTYTHVHVPLTGSPLVDSGLRCAELDQNGNRRPVDGGTGTSQCDRGAEELNAGCGSPGPTTALEPLNGGSNVALQPLLVWEPKAGANTYNVKIATQPPPFGTSLIAEVSGITATHWKPGVTLLSNQVYYWQVKSFSLCGGTKKSEVFSFTTS